MSDLTRLRVGFVSCVGGVLCYRISANRWIIGDTEKVCIKGHGDDYETSLTNWKIAAKIIPAPEHRAQF